MIKTEDQQLERHQKVRGFFSERQRRQFSRYQRQRQRSGEAGDGLGYTRTWETGWGRGGQRKRAERGAGRKEECFGEQLWPMRLWTAKERPRIEKGSAHSVAHKHALLLCTHDVELRGRVSVRTLKNTTQGRTHLGVLRRCAPLRLRISVLPTPFPLLTHPRAGPRSRAPARARRAHATPGPPPLKPPAPARALAAPRRCRMAARASAPEARRGRRRW